MNEPRKYRKRPVVIEAVQWNGDNYTELRDFAGPVKFNPIDEEDRPHTEDPEATAGVFDELHSTWVLAYTGDWIIKGLKGELYPCRPDVFEETYEAVTSDD